MISEKQAWEWLAYDMPNIISQPCDLGKAASEKSWHVDSFGEIIMSTSAPFNTLCKSPDTRMQHAGTLVTWALSGEISGPFMEFDGSLPEIGRDLYSLSNACDSQMSAHLFTRMVHFFTSLAFLPVWFFITRRVDIVDKTLNAVKAAYICFRHRSGHAIIRVPDLQVTMKALREDR
jgi:hypothetical protein